MRHVKIGIILISLFFSIDIQAQNDSVTFHYLGHSSFIILFDDETRILTDYGKPNAYLEYGWDSPIYDAGDIVPTICTYSHFHADHYDSTRISSDDCIITDRADTLFFKDLVIYPIPSSEDDLSVKENRSYLMDYKGIRILHLGDCQANIMYIDSLENKEYVRNNIPRDCDVVLLPIEGKQQFIPQLKTFIEIIRPKTIIPMHYWSRENKKEFLDYMGDEHAEHTTKYNIISQANSKFTYRGRSRTDFIHIIDLEPSDFRDQ